MIAAHDWSRAWRITLLISLWLVPRCPLQFHARGRNRNFCRDEARIDVEDGDTGIALLERQAASGVLADALFARPARRLEIFGDRCQRRLRFARGELEFDFLGRGLDLAGIAGQGDEGFRLGLV